MVHMLSGNIPNHHMTSMQVILSVGRGRIPTYELPAKTRHITRKFISTLLSPEAKRRPNSTEALSHEVFSLMSHPFKNTLELLNSLKIQPNPLYGHTIVHEKYHETLLHYVSENGLIEVLRELLQQTCNLNAKSIFDRTPLHLAVECRNDECVKLLIAAGADVTGVSFVKNLPEQKVVCDVEGSDFSEKPSTRRCTHASARPKCTTSLAVAENKRHYSSDPKSLIAAETELIHKVEAQIMPLHGIVNLDHVQFANKFCATTWNAEARHVLESTKAPSAAQNQRCTCLNELNRVNVPGRFGFRPLHLAVIRGHISCVKTLIACGADPTLKNDYGYTALDMAKNLQSNACYAYLQGVNNA